MKLCYVCQELKSANGFPPNKSTKDGLNRKCRECFNSYMREWYSKNATKHKERVSLSAPVRRARKYGLTPEQVDALFSMYNGKCHLCKVKDATDIDHCHATNVVRGILCSACNTSLGKLGDTPESLQRALDYVINGQTPIQV